MNEIKLINNYFSKLTFQKNNNFALSNDVFDYRKKKIAVTVDTFVEGIHFLKNSNPKSFLKKIFRASVSDLICKNAIPKYYFLSLALNKKYAKKKWISKFIRILNFEQKKYKSFLAGGDTVKSNILTITITFIGTYKNNIISRSGAKNNHDIYVTGCLGDSNVGLDILKKKINLKSINHYFVKQYYEPKIQVGFLNNFDKIVSSSIDISDGLIKDLSHILKESKVGAYININSIPISINLMKLRKKKRIQIYKYIFGGDDYQIIFTSHRKYRNLLKQLSSKNKIKITRIGHITSSQKLNLSYNKKKFKLRSKNIGYIHVF